MISFPMNPVITKIPKLIYSNTGPIPRLPKNESGYLKPGGGIIPPIDVQQDGFGLWCQDEGHQGKVYNITMDIDICHPCDETGPSMKSVVPTWTCPPLELIKCTANAFLLKDSINDNSQLIRGFLREQTGLEYEIHIIEEVAANGSILATEDSMLHHDRAGDGEEELHLPLGYAASVLQYHYAENLKVGYMMNCPGDYNGKISNYEDVLFFLAQLSKRPRHRNLKNFEIAGIYPASVIFMTYGLDVSKETEDNFWGIPEIFTIYSEQKMLDRIEESRTPQGYRIPKSTEANVDGFITSASNHAATRKTRNVDGRKIQGKGKKKH
ncbi:LOW QUALITY PROTEIN: hypothetical protein DAPPUDRAFT_246730 [Daphnia pulex]|uniref:Uncharacterized protein n=1 Tax=Daphnia pulex TaxID=6669 RepID=E9GR46_DAPPU|nr:LOW QUALITY PROTEIN: hypothetical protein DAPPUDRAFT_246730 [Daphnia pulex]|eukprot:EFX77946.1 LOW QUALITY PROTEIN: hypothetical protein DAPPUDRAFT_246730 [Daphnia pulex]